MHAKFIQRKGTWGYTRTQAVGGSRKALEVTREFKLLPEKGIPKCPWANVSRILFGPVVISNETRLRGM